MGIASNFALFAISQRAFDPSTPRNIIFIVIGLVLVLGVFSAFLSKGRDPRDSRSQSSDLWKFGVFYVNPAEPDLFVPKRYGMGYTINFGHRWSWLAILVLLLLIFAPLIYAVFVICTR